MIYQNVTPLDHATRETGVTNLFLLGSDLKLKLTLSLVELPAAWNIFNDII